MKKHILPLFFAFSLAVMQVNAFAQDGEQPATLFGNGPAGFFAAPALGFATMDGSAVSLLQIRGGLTLEDRFSFGAFFQTSLNEIRPQSESLPNSYLDHWVVGGFAEYTAFSKKLVHLTFPLFIGYGEVELDGEFQDEAYGESNFVQLEPSALLEVNLHANVRFNAGVGYRMLSSMTYRNLTATDLEGFTGFVGLKVGLFRS